MSEILAVILTVLFIIFPAEIKQGAKTGIENGIFILIPSIFPYIAISNIFIKTGAADLISELIYKFAKPLFRYKKEFSSSYLISLFCGYPTGAKLSANLEENGKKETLRLFLFGNVPGFGFCVSFLGSLLKNVNTGIKIYLSFVSASLILNYISSFFLKDKETDIPRKNQYCSFSASVTEGVKEAVTAIINIIGYAVFFSSVSEIIKNRYVGAFLEITAGVPKLSNIYEIIFFTGFSGISVIFQSLSFKKDNPNILFILTARFIFAFLSVLIFFLTKFIA